MATSVAAGLVVLLVPAITSFAWCAYHTLGCHEETDSLLLSSPTSPFVLFWLLWILISAPGIWFRSWGRTLSILIVLHALLILVAGFGLTGLFLEESGTHLQPLMVAATILGSIAAMTSAVLDHRRIKTERSATRAAPRTERLTEPPESRRA